MDFRQLLQFIFPTGAYSRKEEQKAGKMSKDESRCEWYAKIIAYAKKNPIKFVSLASFLVLGAIPVVAFLGYSATAVIISCVVAIVVDLFVLSLGAIGLSFVLFFVTCITVCATSVFAGFYFTYRIATGTLQKGFRLNEKSTWPSSVPGSHE